MIIPAILLGFLAGTVSVVFHLTLTEAPALNLLAIILALNIVSGILGFLFNKTLLAAQKLIRLAFWPRSAWWIFTGCDGGGCELALAWVIGGWPRLHQQYFCRLHP
ncbi:MAG: hypothetical protein HOO92_06005 [Methylococcaceae bacterium]|nr:hypothetical protein [Methylococcaceae bacterium]NOU13511.1 hypothetical protein [Methylococcaceae bacterium]